MTLADSLDGLTPELVELRDANRQLQRQLAQAKARTADLIAAVEDAARQAAVTVGAAKIPAKPARDRRKAAGEIALLHTTDWQVGKITPTYNSDIAESRLGEILTHKVERLTALQREAHPVRDAVVFLGGDMVEGITIFPGQAWAVDSTLFDQLFRAAKICETILLHTLSVFDTVDVFEEAGNHGRLGRKGENPAQDNFDRIMYRIVADRFRHEPRLRWHPLESPGIWNHATIGNYRALLVHGDEIKSFGGSTPAFGILRKVTKWRAGVAPMFRDCYMGHFHTPMSLVLPDGGRIFVAGSPESDNGFAAEFMAETGEPSQRLNFIDPDRGRVTAEYLVGFDA